MTVINEGFTLENMTTKLFDKENYEIMKLKIRRQIMNVGGLR